MILEQIHFVDIKEPSIRTRQQTRIEPLSTLGQRAFDVDRPTDSIFSGAEWKLNDRNGRSRGSQRLSFSALRTEISLVCGIAVIGAPIYYRDSWQEVRQRPHRCRLSGASMAHDQNAADRWIDDVQNKGQLHFFLANDRGKRKRPAHMRHTDYTALENSDNSLDIQKERD